MTSNTPRYTCGGCDETWTPLNACHCSACHRTFGGISGFDSHRRGGQCKLPAAFTQDDQGIWRRPDTRPDSLQRSRSATPSLSNGSDIPGHQMSLPGLPEPVPSL